MSYLQFGKCNLFLEFSRHFLILSIFYRLQIQTAFNHFSFVFSFKLHCCNDFSRINSLATCHLLSDLNSIFIKCNVFLYTNNAAKMIHIMKKQKKKGRRRKGWKNLNAYFSLHEHWFDQIFFKAFCSLKCTNPYIVCFKYFFWMP